jgi:tetratricopeptide (TPR) repeat protein/predicted Ser/Thr protein kinase
MASERESTPGADAGRRIGRYELIERIGRGGMGEVFLARDTQLGRTVAIKALASDHVPADSDVERFRQEVANLVAVSHPYVAAVYDVVEEGDDLYIVMEYVRGRSLKDAAAADRRPRTIARWGQQIAEALAGIHAAGIIHRDLKPSNVMIAESGHVKVLDFGIAKRFTAQLDRNGSTIETVEDLTRRGVAVGTPNYMSPEQLRLERLDPRSDLFSLGILLYEALTGSHPFRRATPVDTQAAILAGAPGDGVEPAELAHAGPLREVILRLLEKDPARRYTNASEVAVALDAALSEYSTTGSGEGTLPSQPWWRRPRSIVVAALVVLAAVALLVVGLLVNFGSDEPVLTPAQQQLLGRASDLRAERRYPEALEVLEGELARDPKLLEFEVLRASTLMTAGNERKAREVIDHAQWMAREGDLDPESRLGLELQRVRAAILGRGAEIESATEALSRRFPETPGIQVDYAGVLADQGHFDRALATLEGRLARGPLDANALLVKGRILAGAGRRPEAEAAFEAAEAAFRSLALPTGTAAVETARGVVNFEIDARPAQALEHFQKATVLYRAGGQPSLEAFSRYQEAGALLMMGRTPEALAGFIEAQRAASEHGDLSLAAMAQDAHAVALIRLGRPAEALPLLRQTVDQATLLGDFSLSLSAQGNLVALLLVTGEYDEARRAATEAIALARQQSDASRHELTHSLILAEIDLQQGRTEAALTEMRRILADQQGMQGTEAGRAEASLALGNALVSLERYGEALDPLTVACRGWERAGDSDQQGYALIARAYAHAAQSGLAAARADLDAAVRAAGSGNLGVQQGASLVEGLVLWKEGRNARAAAHLSALRERAAASGQRPLAIDAAILESGARRAAGQAGSALQIAQQAAREATFSELRRVRARAAEAEALAALGRPNEMRPVADEAAAAAERLGLVVTASTMRVLTDSRHR